MLRRDVERGGPRRLAGDDEDGRLLGVRGGDAIYFTGDDRITAGAAR